ncbi:MAG: Clp protease N-terminal domain-containing protein, partial [Nitrospinota bacterium]
MFKKFTERARKVIILAREQAEKNQHEYLGTEHLLLGIIQDTGGVAIAVLQRLSIDLRQIRLEIEKNMPPSSNSLVVGDIPFTSRAKKVLEYSVEEARSLGDAYIGTEHLLLGLMREKDGVGARVLTQMKVTYADVKEHTLSLLREPTVGQEKQQVSKTPALEEFGRDLTELALKNELDPVIGRDEEIQRLLQILSRRTKNNPVLIGEAGVGKTAIVEGMAQKIVSREVPQILHSKRVISLDLGAVIAGTKYRGQFEQRIKAIMKEIIRSKKIILFIDELHTLVGAGAAEGSVDASNMLKPALSRGDIQCIGATTLDEYRKYIEKNGALERRFQSIIVQPPNIKETIDIIYGLKSKYEQHHNAIFSDEAIKAAVRMSDRYIPDRFLPDKAIDVIDEAGSKVHLKKVTFPDEMKELQVAIDAIVKEKKERISKQEFEKAVELRDQEEKLHVDLDKMRYDWELAQEDSVPVVTHDDIAYVVSMIADIPLQKVAKGESEKLLKLSLELKKHIFGQDEAVNSISKAIRRSRMGLKEVDRPMGVFL